MCLVRMAGRMGARPLLYHHPVCLLYVSAFFAEVCASQRCAQCCVVIEVALLLVTKLLHGITVVVVH